MADLVSNVSVQGSAFVGALAELLQYNSWEVQSGSYNGVLFHMLLPNISQINPAQGAVNYLTASNTSTPIGSFTGATTMADTVKKKLAVYPIPNSDFDEIENFGTHSVRLSVVGVMYGLNYNVLLEKANKYFLDEPQDPTLPESEQTGRVSQTNFRVLVHPFFGTVNDVYLDSWRIVHGSERFQAVSFILDLLVKNPSYLTNVVVRPTWQAQVQSLLNGSQAYVTSILQSFSLVNAIVPSATDGFTEVPATASGIDTKGTYLTFIERQINNSLQELSDVFENSIAFLVQNDGGSLTNAYFDAVNIDYSVLPIPIPTAAETQFTYSNAQDLITNYSMQVDSFIESINAQGYGEQLQSNIISLRDSIQNMDAVSKGLLLRQRNIKTVTLTAVSSLIRIINDNGAKLSDLSEISALNSGRYFNSAYIDKGTQIELIV